MYTESALIDNKDCGCNGVLPLTSLLSVVEGVSRVYVYVSVLCQYIYTCSFSVRSTIDDLD